MGVKTDYIQRIAEIRKEWEENHESHSSEGRTVKKVRAHPRAVRAKRIGRTSARRRRKGNGKRKA